MYIQTLANALGYVGLVLLFIQILIGSRHIFKYFTTDTVLINKIHKYLGIYGSLLAFAHPIEETVAYMSSWSWLFIINFSNNIESYISLGRIALYLMLAIWITSAIVREQIKWKPWKYVHLLSYPLFIFVLMHALYSGSWAKEFFLLRIALYILGLIFIGIIIRRLMSWMGFFKHKYMIKSMENVENEIIILTLTPCGDSNVVPTEYVCGGIDIPKIGQHAYLQLNPFFSEHPFTVMEIGVGGELVFGIRNIGAFANNLHMKLQGEKILLDGPYGVFTREAQNAEPKVIISGGVGVTPFVRLVGEYGGENTWYMNCNRTQSIAIRRNYIMSHVGHYKDVDGIIDAMTIQNFLSLVPQPQLLNYFVCGSPGFIFAVKKILTGLGVDKKRIYFEELGF